MNSDSSIPDSLKPIDCSSEQLLHDLQVRQIALEFKLIELEVQNEHLRSAQTKHEETDGYYADLFTNAPVGYVTLTDKGLISDANKAATELFGMERHNLLSLRFASFVAPDDGDRWYLLFAQLIKHNQSVDIELVLKDSQRNEVPVQLNCQSINSTVRISITDISTIKQTETVLRDGYVTLAIHTERILLLATYEDLLCRLQKIANLVPGVIYQYLLRPDGSFCFPYASEALFDIYRLRPEEVSEDASKAYALIHPDDCEGFIASIQASARDLTPWYYEYRIKFDDGTVRWILGNSLPQREADGSTLWHGISADITEHKQMEQSLSDSESRWKFAIEGSGDGVWDRNMQTNQIEYSNRWKEMFGYSENDPLPTDQDWKNNIHPDDQAYVTGLLLTHSEGISPSIRAEYRMRCKDGSYKWILSRSQVVSYGEDGQPLRMVGMHTDISAHRLAEVNLRKNKAQLNEAMRIGKMSSWQVDFATGHIDWSEEIYGLLGVSPVVSPPDYNEQQIFFTVESWARVNTAVALIQETGVPFQLELEVVRTDNTPLSVIMGGEVTRNSSGTISSLQGMIQDISERKRIELSLSNAYAFNKSILNSLPMHVCVLNEFGIILAVNNAWDQFTLENGGCKKYQSFIGINYLDVCASCNQNDEYNHEALAARQGILAVLGGDLKVFNMDYPCHSPTQQRWFHIKVTRLDNTIGHVVVSHDNITKRKQREQTDKEHLDQLAHVTRLGLMGEMASGLSHEINQPLAAIVNYAQASLNLMKKKNPDLVKLAEVTTKTMEQALRAGKIIHRMKAFCNSKTQLRSKTDINELIIDSVNLCADQLKQNSIGITFKLEDQLPLIEIDDIQVEQVIINLIRNGMDAIVNMPEKKLGEITIQSYLTPNHEIQVRVKDNGPGIEEQEQLKILTPFHTTKAEGMGMGLSISRSLIEAHKGTLHFNSQYGKGSTFYFTLPI